MVLVGVARRPSTTLFERSPAPPAALRKGGKLFAYLVKCDLVSAHRQHQPPIAFIHPHRNPVFDIAAQNHIGERVLQIFLHGAFQRTCAINGIIANPAKPSAGPAGELAADSSQGGGDVDRVADEHQAALEVLHQI